MKLLAIALAVLALAPNAFTTNQISLENKMAAEMIIRQVLSNNLLANASERATKEQILRVVIADTPDTKIHSLQCEQASPVLCTITLIIGPHAYAVEARVDSGSVTSAGMNGL